jgi:peptidoglycan/xylan/chitin deacetylase (PgdA/CDA1 family)
MRWVAWADALLCLLVLYFYLPDLTGESRERLLSRAYWLARLRGDLTMRDGVLWRGDPAQRVVALTFDDGPDPATTPRVLDVLKQEGVKATFFVVGTKLKRHPELARRIVRRGTHSAATATTTSVRPNSPKSRSGDRFAIAKCWRNGQG